MAGETSAIAKMAIYVSDEILTWFRWERFSLADQNFDCVKTDKHAPQKSTHTHPVDVVFFYTDPYENTIVYLNTDLKSYAQGSIDATRIFSSLKSLSQTIECARVSEEWQDRYHQFGDLPYEIRAMLFVYNHDAEFDKNFLDVLTAPVKRRGTKTESPLKLETLPIADGQVIHIIEPRTISYLTTVVADAQKLHAQGSFPEKNYEFLYPDLKLHKAHGLPYNRPATIELLTGPYLIIRHDKVVKLNESTGKTEERHPEGYVVYYNRPGGTTEEFTYLLDILSGYQILDSDNKIRIRVAHEKPEGDPRSNFNRAVNLYAHEWGFDTHKTNRLKNIELEIIEKYRYSFSRTVIGWDENDRRKNT